MNKMTKKFIIPLVLIFVAVCFWVFYSAYNHYDRVIVGGKTFLVDTVRSKYAMQVGLSDRDKLLSDNGMLFVFKNPEKHGIWMKNMKFPIDILWIDQNFKIIHMEKSIATSTYPKVFTPNSSDMYVLEISAGQLDVLGVKTDDFVVFLKN